MSFHLANLEENHKAHAVLITISLEREIGVGRPEYVYLHFPRLDQGGLNPFDGTDQGNTIRVS